MLHPWFVHIFDFGTESVQQGFVYLIIVSCAGTIPAARAAASLVGGVSAWTLGACYTYDVSNMVTLALRKATHY